jgi:uncharacterized protein (TIGR02246 family)
MSTHASHPHAAQSRDTADISALYQELLDGWNQRDAAAYAALFAEDASVVGFDGSPMNGRTEIATQIGQIFADHPTSRYVGKVREVRLLTRAIGSQAGCQCHPVARGRKAPRSMADRAVSKYPGALRWPAGAGATAD